MTLDVLRITLRLFVFANVNFGSFPARNAKQCSEHQKCLQVIIIKIIIVVVIESSPNGIEKLHRQFYFIRMMLMMMMMMISLDL